MMPTAEIRPSRPFPQAARAELRNTRMRQNIRHATTTIRRRTDQVTGELPDWQDLRIAGSAIKADALRNLEANLIKLEQMVTEAGGHVHWARDAEEARRIIVDLARAQGGRTVVKVKSITTEEIGLNPALREARMEPVETDLAELIVQLANDTSSHFLVPAIHKNRADIRALFREKFGQKDIGEAPEDLTSAARAHLRRCFLDANVAISGANFAIAETGAICVLESEGNGRMCLTLSKTLITLMGIEKVLPRWQDLEVFLQLLPRASTGERMNPYTSIWTGVRPGDGPQVFHLVLLDNGRTRILANELTRETLHCIRCSRCLNVCPVYERTGGHAYMSEYPGPIGAILTPQLRGLDRAGTLPFASTLCGACQEACPVNINIPQILVHLRGEVVAGKRSGWWGSLDPENVAMKAALWMFEDPRRLSRIEELGRLASVPFARQGELSWLPGPLSGWTRTRNFPEPAAQSFRAWWKQREGQK